MGTQQLTLCEGGWFPFPRKLPRIMPESACIMLAFLANEAHRFQTQKKTYCPYPLSKRHGWFKCSSVRLREAIDYSLMREKRWLRWLREHEYVESKRAGLGAHRFLRVNVEKVRRDISDYETMKAGRAFPWTTEKHT